MGLTGSEHVHGAVAPGFEEVRDAFKASLSDNAGEGAAFAVTHDGELVVDLWGGYADGAEGRPWERETLQVIFSGTKALVAVCLLMLVDRGELDLDAPVSRYWPDFAAEDKGGVRVLELASHQARLPGIHERVAENDILDDRLMARLLATQRQDSERARDMYHALTFGWLCGELIRRVDGRSVGRFFADEIAAPLGLEIWIGLPPDKERAVSTISYGPNWWESPQLDVLARAEDDLLACVWHNPPIFPADHIPWNMPAFHRAEIPGAGGIGTARSLARLFGCLARGGELDGIRLLSPEVIELGSREVTRRWEPLIEETMAFGVGFELQTDEYEFGPPSDAFGHGGAGGSIHCAWPSQAVGVSYAMNVLRSDNPGQGRAQRLLAATDRALKM